MGNYWGRSLVSAIPMSAINEINKVLGPRFVTKWGTKQGILVLGRELPFGFGAGIGAAGNYFVGKASVKMARRAFGPAPKDWPEPSKSNTSGGGAALLETSPSPDSEA
jgi:hypothetical protein